MELLSSVCVVEQKGIQGGTMIELFYIGIDIAILSLCIVGCSFMICNKISGLTHEIWELRLDLKKEKQR